MTNDIEHLFLKLITLYLGEMSKSSGDVEMSVLHS